MRSPCQTEPGRQVLRGQRAVQLLQPPHVPEGSAAQGVVIVGGHGAVGLGSGRQVEVGRSSRPGLPRAG